MTTETEDAAGRHICCDADWPIRDGRCVNCHAGVEGDALDLDIALNLLHFASDFWFDSSKVMGTAHAEAGKAELTAKWHDRVVALLEKHDVDYLKPATSSEGGP